jgi:phosphoribosylformylglycinamidine synthase subunit PurQ / glutaminase
MKLADPTLSALRVGVVQFPGSNCDDDCVDALHRHFGLSAIKLWHTDSSFPKMDALILPGGFSYGDYLRSGALAAHSPIMAPIKSFARQGGAILGICNGFQILTESGLLPGALLLNSKLKFVCKTTTIKGVDGSVLSVPIAHGEGRYWVSEADLEKLEAEGQIAFKYCSPNGAVDGDCNPNGSVANIAGVYSRNRKVLGMMPHPERATDRILGGSEDGIKIFKDFFSQI